jgi:hypothetical protein
MAIQYGRIFDRAARERHTGVVLRLTDASTTILARNDADLYASWRLTRVNAVIACGTLALALLMWMVLRR